MESRRVVNKDHPFVVTSDSLRHLVAALPPGEYPPNISATCIDGTTLYPKSLDELFEYPNPKTREITALKINSSEWNVEFSDNPYRTVTYRIEGEDKNVVSISHTMETHLEPMTSHGFVFLSTNTSLESASVVLSWVVGGWAVSIGGMLIFINHAQHKHLGVASAWLVSLGILFILIGTQANRMRRYFFPAAIFCIGDGKNRYDKMLEKRKLFGLSALVALVIGIAGSVIASLISTR